jgi:hypothetical protein
MSPPLKMAPPEADDSRVTEHPLHNTLDDDQVTAIVGTLYGRVRDHIAVQYERQAGQCAGCGRTLPTRADALIGPDGHLECVDCRLTTHRAVA